MICPKCHSEIDNGAKFCTHCGSSLTQQEGENGCASILIFIWIVIQSLTCIINQIIYAVCDSWYSSSAKYVVYSLWIISNASMVLVPFGIRNKVLKIIGLVIAIALALFYIYSNIRAMTVEY